jgi:hypothetical protein
VTFAPVVLQNVMTESDLLDYFNGDGEQEVAASGSAPRLESGVLSPRKQLAGVKSPMSSSVPDAVATGDDVDSDVKEDEIVPRGKEEDEFGITDDDLEHIILIKDCGGLCMFDFGQAACVGDCGWGCGWGHVMD